MIPRSLGVITKELSIQEFGVFRRLKISKCSFLRSRLNVPQFSVHLSDVPFFLNACFLITAYFRFSFAYYHKNCALRSFGILKTENFSTVLFEGVIQRSGITTLPDFFLIFRIICFTCDLQFLAKICSPDFLFFLFPPSKGTWMRDPRSLAYYQRTAPEVFLLFEARSPPPYIALAISHIP
ncbi:hypothetical protein TNCV_3656531 [Trichonephila clavipes]|nr:hypothetical protein TNCV_3656531 [Trichonephila clavipes]